jgi:hypothetical protein
MNQQAPAAPWSPTGPSSRPNYPNPLDWPVPIEDPAGQGPLIWINPVSEPKSVKNRMHVDVVGDKAELLSLGATMVRARDEEIEWDILADPEGNEFCVFAPQP